MTETLEFKGDEVEIKCDNDAKVLYKFKSEEDMDAFEARIVAGGSPWFTSKDTEVEIVTCGDKAGRTVDPMTEMKANIGMVKAVAAIVLTGIVGFGIVCGIFIGWVIFG